MLINAKFIHIGERRNYETGIARTRIQTRFETFQLSRKRAADGGEFYDLAMNEREIQS